MHAGSAQRGHRLLRTSMSCGADRGGELHEMTSIDELDAEMLRILAADPRCGVLTLAERLGVSRNTAQARLARLQDTRLVKGWIPLVDLAQLGFDVQAIVEIELSQGSLEPVVDSLRGTPQVLEVFATTGDGDLLVRVASQSHEALQQLLQQVLAISGVVRTRTLVALSNPVPYRTQPLVDHVTAGSGRGRAQP